MKTKLSTLACGILAAFAVSAQTPPEGLVNAARKAVTSNPEVQARWFGFQAADSERSGAKGGFFPRLDATVSTGRESYKTPSASFGTFTRNSSNLTLTQMVFDGAFTISEVKRLGHAKLTRYYELMDVSENTALESVRAYLDVVRYNELVDQAKQNYAEHKLITNQVEERSKSGVGRRVDLEQAVGRLALAESNLLTELSNLHDVSTRYLRIVGERPAGATEAMPEGFQFATLPAKSEDAVRAALGNSPALNAAMQNYMAGQAAVETRRSAYLPRFDVRLRQAWDTNLLGDRGQTRDSALELVMNYNLFRGGSDKAREQQEIANREQARELQDKACRDVRQNVAIAFNDVNRLNDQLTFLNQHRLSTEKSREAYRQQFDLGQRTLLDLLDTQNEYFQASRSYINARYDQITAQARTLASSGNLLATLNVARKDLPSASEAGQDTRSDSANVCPADTIDLVVIDKAKILADMPVRARATPPAAKPAAPAK